MRPPLLWSVLTLCMAIAFSANGKHGLADSIQGIPNFLDRTYLFNFEKKYPYEADTRLLFEGYVAPTYLLYTNLRKANPKKFALSITPDIRMRLLHEFSGPIVNPSYMLHIRYHRLVNVRKKVLQQRNYVISVNHHSNGQTGHIAPDSLLNLKTGNFSTHYFDLYHFWTLAHYLRKWKFIHHIGLGFEEHFPDSIGGSEVPGGMSKFLGDNYGKHRAIFDYTLEHCLQTQNFLNGLLLKLHINFNYSLTKPIGNPLHPQLRDPSKLPRYMLNVSAIFKPPWDNDISFFVRFRSGQDHYNAYFFNDLTQFQFGFLLENALLKPR